MKKAVSLITAVVLAMMLCVPTFAGSWEQFESGEWTYYNDDGNRAANQWVPDNGNWYYIGPDKLMLTSNYTPDGFWVNAAGVYEPQWGQRTDSAAPYTGTAYGNDFYTYSFFRDVYGDGVEHWSLTETVYNSSRTYELYPQSAFSFEIMDIYSGMSMGYLSVSPDRRVVYVTMGGYTQRCEAR